MAVSFRNDAYTVEAVSGQPTQPFLALGSALTITAPAATYVNSTQDFSMSFTVDIPAMGVAATTATLQSVGDQLDMQVIEAA
jgi:hypothetical protein